MNTRPFRRQLLRLADLVRFEGRLFLDLGAPAACMELRVGDGTSAPSDG